MRRYSVTVPKRPGLDCGRLKTRGVDFGPRLKSLKYTEELEHEPKGFDANF